MNERDIFTAALAQQSATERSAYLDQACAGDADLRGRVEVLISQHEQLGSFLESPAPKLAATVDAPPSERPGMVIGPYKLLQKIGEGGMGVVFMAEQKQPVERRVALKIIKPGMDSEYIIARFEAERQALAMMDHPNIAKVFDAGTVGQAFQPDTGLPSQAGKPDLPLGRPYFVMDLVKGVPITKFCDEHHLTVRERLELFLPVCHAIQHAHQKGIIHRDVKPTNVMVALYDDHPVPKVIDFGVAKAISQRLTERTMFTQFGQLVGTMEYMSPEQAKLNQLDIDTRSDIYSLGVLLYELLTGSTPFEKGRLRSAAFDEMLRIIREEEPPRPSTRLSELSSHHAPRDEPNGHVTRSVTATLASISAMRNTEPARLSKTVRGELDWIVMKSLDKDRARRYETANGLSHDIERYLHDEPVQACPPSAVYRFQKFARRNKVAFGAATAVVLALLLGLVGLGVSNRLIARERDAKQSALLDREAALGEKELALAATQKAQAEETVQRKRAEQESVEAQRQRQQAEKNYHTARAAVDDMYTQVAEKWLSRQPKLEPLQREFLQKALKFYGEFAQVASADPDVRLETARAYRRVGDIHFRLGATGPAEEAFRQAIAVLQKLVADFPSAPQYQKALADTLHGLGLLHTDTGRAAEGAKARRQAIALQEKLVAGFPAVPEYRGDLARGLYSLADALGAWGTGEGAERAVVLRQSVALLQKLTAEFPLVAAYRYDLANSHHGMGEYHSAAELLEKLVAEFPSEPEYRSALAMPYFELRNEFPSQKGEESLRKALALQKQLEADFPSVAYYRFDLLKSLLALGERMSLTNRTEEAEQAFRQGAAAGEKLAADSPTIPYFRNRLAQVYLAQAVLRSRTGPAHDAESPFRQALAVYAKLTAELPNKAEYRAEHSACYARIAAVWLSQATQVEKDTKLSKTERETQAQAYRTRAGELLREQARLGLPNPADALNQAAWRLVIAPNPDHRHPEYAVELAKLAVQRSPENRWFVKTLGTAYYRAGDWKAAIDTLKKVDEPYGGGWLSVTGFVIAMAHWQREKLARKWYAPALVWMEKHAPKDAVFLAFRGEAASLLGLSEKLTREQEQAKADNVKFYALVLEADPRSAWAYRDLGRIHAERGHLDQAGRYLATAVDLSPNQPFPRYYIALVRLAIRDEPGYRKACADMLQRFGRSSDPEAAYWTAWTCVLAPAAVTDWQPVVQSAEKTLASDPKSFDKLQNLAAVLYRAGRFEDAAKRLTEAETAFKETKNPRSSSIYTRLFLAMTKHRLGRAAEAKEQLDLAIGEIEKLAPASAGNAATVPWNRRLTLQLLRREAEELLK